MHQRQFLLVKFSLLREVTGQVLLTLLLRWFLDFLNVSEHISHKYTKPRERSDSIEYVNFFKNHIIRARGGGPHHVNTYGMIDSAAQCYVIFYE